METKLKTKPVPASLTRFERDELIVDNLGYVKHILGKILAQLPRGVDGENLESAGILGLVEAAGHFDPTRKIEFRSFSYQRIRGAILDELRRNCPLSQQMLQKIAVLRQARQQIQGAVTIERLAEAADMSVEDVSECAQASRVARPRGWADSIDVHDEPRSECPLEKHEKLEILADGIEALPDNMRMAITLHYTEGLKLKEIGAVLDLSESRVCRIVNSAKEKLTEYVRQRGYVM